MKHYPEHSNRNFSRVSNRRVIPLQDSVPPKQLSIYTDGGSRGNPGEASAGVIIYNGADTLANVAIDERS